MARKNTPASALRDTSMPYRLPLSIETNFPDLSDLTDDAKSDPSKNYWFYCKPVLFKDNVLTLKSDFRNETYRQQVTINEDHLLVSCDCGSKVKKLCAHLVTLFTKLSDHKKYQYFEQFKSYPYSDSHFFDKYLTLETSWYEVNAIPKPEFGKIYKFGDGIDGRKFPLLPNFLPPSIPDNDAETTSITYVMANLDYGMGFPFLIPCLAKLDEQKTGISGFIKFLEPSYQTSLSVMQKAVHAYCEDFNRLVGFNNTPKQHRDQGYQEQEAIDNQRLQAFTLWKNTIAALKDQRVYYYSGFYNKINFKERPKKSYMSPITFSEEKASFQMFFTEHAGYYRLTCQLLLAGKTEKIKAVFPDESPFFFTLEQEPAVYYHFATLEEGQIISEFLLADFGFTILQEDLEAFNKEILSTLAIDYPITYQFLNEPEVCQLNAVERQIILKDHGQYVSFVPAIKYDNGSSYPLTAKGQEMFRFENGACQLIQRDKLEEDSFKAAFIRLHPAFKRQSDQGSFYLSKDALTEHLWLARCLYHTTDVTFIGLELIQGLNLHLGEAVISTDVVAEKDWFDITVSVKFGDEELEPEAIQRALKKGAPIIELANGKAAYLPDTFFSRLRNTFRNGILTEKGIKIPGQHYTLIDRLYDQLAKPELANLVAERKLIFDQIEKTPLMNVPENVNAVLRNYQLTGFSWMCHLNTHNWGGLLADDMGLGKTLQVLTLLQYLKNESLAKAPHMVIAPTSLLFNWREEAEKFCPELHVLTFHGLAREKNADELAKYDLIITSYGTSSVDIEFLSGMRFHYLILDEAQAIKNPYSQRYKTTMLIPAENRLALTGTPVENSSTDLYALMNFINPGFFGTLRMFKENLLAQGNEDDAERAATLLKMIGPFILRRTKKQVASDLPPKTEMILWCEMEPAQRKIYDNYRKVFKESLVGRFDRDGLERSKFHVLDGLMKLRQICNSPLLMKNAPAFHGTSCKITELMSHVTEKTIGHKLLVFSQFTSMLSLVRTELENQSISYAYLDGKTTPANRKNAVENFQNEESIRVFLISLKAGGVGLNLTAADYVYLLDPWWNPAKEAQAIDRCYRIGQDKHVMAYKVICKDTLEERILDMQQRKKRLADELIPTDEGVLKTMDKDEILGLLD